MAACDGIDLLVHTNVVDGHCESAGGAVVLAIPAHFEVVLDFF